MLFRRIIASFFVFLFAVTAVPTFFVYALSRTYFSGSFYQGPVVEGAYDFFVERATKTFYESDPTIQRYFQQEDLQKQLQTVFTVELFRKIMGEAGQQIENLKNKPNEPATISLRVFKESLLTVAHNLAYNLFESRPKCQDEQLPEVNEEGIPTCVPKDIDYSDISAPLSKQFERAINEVLRDNIQIDLTADHTGAVYQLFSWVSKLNFYLLGVMLVLTGMIALFIYKPLSLLLRFEGIAFFMSGMIGLFSSFAFQFFPQIILQNYRKGIPGSTAGFLGDKERFETFLEYLTSFITWEVQKIAFVFLLLGALLFLIDFILKKRFSPSKT